MTIEPTSRSTVQDARSGVGAQRKLRARSLLWVLGPPVFYLALTLVLVWPLPLHLNAAAFGWEGKDQPEYIWSLWFSARQLLSGRNPAAMAQLAHPDGYFHTIRWATLTTYVASLPLAWVPAVARYNLLIILGTAATAYTAYLLACDVTRNRWAALVGGWLFMLFPARWGHVLGGHLETAQTYWYPLAFLALRKLTDKPDLRAAAVNGLVWALAAMNSLPGTAYVLLPLGLTYSAAALVWAGDRTRRLRLLRRFVLSGVVGGVLLAPFVLPLLRDLVSTASWLVEGGDAAFSIDLISMVAPPPGAPIWKITGTVPAAVVDAVAQHPQEVMGYLGVLPVGLAAAALLRRDSRREITLLAGLAAVTAVLALGPQLRVAGALARLGSEPGVPGSPIPLPYTFLASIPGLSIGRTPGRFLLLTGLLLAVLAAQGWAIVMNRHLTGRAARGLLSGVIMILVSTGYVVSWPSPLYALPTSEAAGALAHLPAGAVLDVPLPVRQVGQESLLRQIEHGQPIVGGYVHRSLPVAPGEKELLDWATRPSGHTLLTASPTADAAQQALSSAGVRYVILHRAFAQDAETWERALVERLGSAVAADDRIAIYEVPVAPPPSDPLLGEGAARWEEGGEIDGAPARWTSDRSGKIGLYAPSAMEAEVVFRAVAVDQPRRLAFSLNGQVVGQVVVGPWQTYRLPGLALLEGFNQLTWREVTPCVEVRGDPRCRVHRLFYEGPMACDPWDQVTRCVGVLMQEVTLQTGGQRSAAFDVPAAGSLTLAWQPVETCVTAGETLTLPLVLQAADALSDEPHVFVHVLADDGRLVVQEDRVPLKPFYPHMAWTAGDTVTEHFTLSLPVDLASGRYTLAAGVYSYPELTRWPVTLSQTSSQDLSEHGLVWLGEVTAGPACENRAE